MDTKMFEYEFTCANNINEVIKSLKVHGIAHIPNFITDTDLVMLNQEFEKILLSDSKAIFSQAPHPKNPEGRTARFSPWHVDALHDFPAISELFRDAFMSDVANKYYGPHDVDLNDEVFITHEKPAPNPILPWHFDRVQSIKFWFNLTDTTEENGAFEYCPGTHWEGHYRAGYHLSQGTAVQDIPNDIDIDFIRNPVTLELGAGDLLIFDSDGFHRGGVVSPNTERRVLRGHTHPKGVRRYGDRPLSKGWWLSSLLNLNKWTGNASKRIVGKDVAEKTINRKLNK